jgi:hypothetical protein
MISARHHTKCAKEGCQTLIKRGWFCPSHWYALPKEELRDPLLAAFNAATAAHGRLPREEQDRLNRAYGVLFREALELLARVPRTDAAVMSTVAYDARDYAEKRIAGGQPKEFRYVGGRRL